MSLTKSQIAPSLLASLQSDIGVTGAEKSALEQQISTLQISNERSERQGKQEVARMQVELQSLRQRLDRADADLIHSRRENVRLNEQIAALEKEVTTYKISSIQYIYIVIDKHINQYNLLSLVASFWKIYALPYKSFL